MSSLFGLALGNCYYSQVICEVRLQDPSSKVGGVTGASGRRARVCL
jgi:hypothetical protein